MMVSMPYPSNRDTEEPAASVPDAVAEALGDVEPQMETTESSLERLLDGLRSLP